MPVSRKRKKSKISKRRELVFAPVNSEAWSIYIKPTSIVSLKNDPNFLDLVKIGRVINHLTFASQCIADNHKQNTPAQTRQYRHGHLMLAAYTHQGLQLARSIQGRYLGKPEFEMLRLMVYDNAYKKGRTIVKAIRNFSAFHLDEFDVTTRETLSRMKPLRAELFAGADDSVLAMYFEFSDLIDAMFLIKKFGEGDDEIKRAEDFWATVIAFGSEMLAACHIFSQYLIEQSDLKEHVEKRVSGQRTFAKT